MLPPTGVCSGGEEKWIPVKRRLFRRWCLHWEIIALKCSEQIPNPQSTLAFSRREFPLAATPPLCHQSVAQEQAQHHLWLVPAPFVAGSSSPRQLLSGCVTPCLHANASLAGGAHIFLTLSFCLQETDNKIN